VLLLQQHLLVVALLLLKECQHQPLAPSITGMCDATNVNSNLMTTHGHSERAVHAAGDGDCCWPGCSRRPTLAASLWMHEMRLEREYVSLEFVHQDVASTGRL
jgi:hypothetical protein